MSNEKTGTDATQLATTIFAGLTVVVGLLPPLLAWLKQKQDSQTTTRANAVSEIKTLWDLKISSEGELKKRDDEISSLRDQLRDQKDLKHDFKELARSALSRAQNAGAKIDELVDTCKELDARSALLK